MSRHRTINILTFLNQPIPNIIRTWPLSSCNPLVPSTRDACAPIAIGGPRPPSRRADPGYSGSGRSRSTLYKNLPQNIRTLHAPANFNSTTYQISPGIKKGIELSFNPSFIYLTVKHYSSVFFLAGAFLVFFSFASAAGASTTVASSTPSVAFFFVRLRRVVAFFATASLEYSVL